MFDAVMNYQFTAACVGFFGKGSRDDGLISGMMGLPEIPELDASDFAQRTRQLLEIYPRQNALAQLNLLDSHDMPRFLSMVRGKKDAFRLASLFQMTYPGAPCIYYGDEIGLMGGRDPDCRAPFPWDEADWDHDLHNAIRTYPSAVSIRFTCRQFEPVFAQEACLARHLDGEQLFVLLNRCSTWDFNVPMENGLTPLNSRTCWAVKGL